MNRLQIIILLLAGGAGLRASGQSATNFDREAAPVAEESPEVVATPQLAKATSTSEPTERIVDQPSRMVLLDAEPYLSAVASSLSMQTRQWDPFSRNQSPDYVPPQPKKVERTMAVAGQKVPSIPFSDIVAGIRVSTVVPGQGTFLVGGRSFRVGDRIELNTGERLLPVSVMSVRSSAIRFRNEVSGEEADLRLDILPEGLTRGSKVTPPGVVSADADAPLSITPVGRPSVRN